MKKVFLLGITVLMLLSFEKAAGAKTLKLALDIVPKTMDIQEQLSSEMVQFSHWVFDPLVRWSQDMNFEPRLATKWKRIDNLTMRFHLRKGVKFHSGNPFTAKDVVFTINRFKKSADYKKLFEPFGEARIVDDYTVDITTKKSYAMLLNMAAYIFPIDSKFYTGKDDQGKSKDVCLRIGYTYAKATLPSGTGAFKCTSYEYGSKLIMERFKDHWDKKSSGNIDKIILTPIKEDAKRVAALLAGDVDFISPVPIAEFKKIQKDKKVELHTINSDSIVTVQMNQKRSKPLRNKKVRQAIVLAIDNGSITKKIMKESAAPAGQMSPKGYLGFNESLVPRFDLKTAKKLMKEAGYPEGFKANMIASKNLFENDEEIAIAFCEMLSKIKIDVQLKIVPKAQYKFEFKKYAADFQLMHSNPIIVNSNHLFASQVMWSDKEKGYGKYNSGSYCNRAVDVLSLSSQTETSPTKRKQIFQAIEQILYEDAAFVTICWRGHSYGVKKGVEAAPIINMQNYPYFGDMVIK